jgi:hypothetical protein
MIAANNHYAGFGPGIVNIFRNMVGPSELSWEDEAQIQELLRRQIEQEEDKQPSNSKIPPSNQKRKRQSSLTEYRIK